MQRQTTVLLVALSLFVMVVVAPAQSKGTTSCTGCTDRTVQAVPQPNQTIGPTVSSNDTFGTPSAMILGKLEGRRKLEERKQAIEESAVLQRLTEQFQQEVQGRTEWTEAERKQLKQMTRMAKSIRSKLED